MARCYVKTLELRGWGGEWPKAIWKGWDREQPVWRVEFQFRRRSLVSLGDSSPAEALEARRELWRCTTQWVSLEVPTSDSHRSRWPGAREWQVIREAEIGSPASPLVRDLVRSTDELLIIRGLVGCVSRLPAMGAAHGLGAALGRTVRGVYDYLERRGATFSETVDRKGRQRMEVAASTAAGRGLLDTGSAGKGTEPRNSGFEPTGLDRP